MLGPSFDLTRGTGRRNARHRQAQGAQGAHAANTQQEFLHHAAVEVRPI